MYTYIKAPKENTTLCKRLAKEGCMYNSTSIHLLIIKAPSLITKATPLTEVLEQIGSFSWYVERPKAVNLKHRVIHHCNGQVDS